MRPSFCERALSVPVAMVPRHWRPGTELKSRGDRIRDGIVRELMAFGRPASLAELAKRLGRSAANTNQHLTALLSLGHVEIVGNRKRNRLWRPMA